MAPLRPRRSLMYTPGTRPDRIEKALTAQAGADAVVADLEDAVAPEDKQKAREQVADVIGRVREARAERCVRVNGFGTEWYENDLTRVVGAGPDAIVVPKVESPATIADVDEQITWLEEAEGLDPGSVQVVAQLETARGIAGAVDIAEAIAETDRVTALVFGSLDYARDVGARNTPSNREVLYARQRVVLAAALAGVQALDQLFDDYRDPDGLEEEAREGRDFGFVGKQIIHPAQIEPVHRVFTPTGDELAEARELLAAAREAGIEEGGVIGFKGRMIDRPAIEQARRVVELADALGL